MLLLVTIIIVVVIVVIVTTTIFCNTLPFETNRLMNFLLPLSIVFFLFKCGYVTSRPKRITYPLFNFCQQSKCDYRYFWNRCAMQFLFFVSCYLPLFLLVFFISTFYYFKFFYVSEVFFFINYKRVHDFIVSIVKLFIFYLSIFSLKLIYEIKNTKYLKKMV